MENKEIKIEFEPDKHIDEVTLKDVEEALKKAYLEGWESDDCFLLATNFEY